MIPLRRPTLHPAVLLVVIAVPAAVVGALLLDARGLAPYRLTLPIAAVLTGLVLLTMRRGIEAVGLVLLAGAVGTASWNATSIRGLPPAHLCLATALLILVPVAVANRRRVVMPGWVWVLGGGIIAVTAISVVLPVSASYLAGRFEVPLEPVLVARIPAPDVADRLNAVRWLIPAVLLPLAGCLAIAPAPDRARPLADVWILGVTANAAAGITDQLSITHLSAALLPFVDIGGRQAGLTAQPNHLALSAALALPVAVWRFTRPSSRHSGLVRAAALLCTLVLLGGILVSGSRGGLAIAAFAVTVALLISQPGRRLLPWLLGIGAAGATILAALHPELLAATGTRLRLVGAASAEESDAIRSRIHAQALEDFAHDPLRGIGLHVLSDGHNIYLQLVASGGALLFVAFLVTVTGVWRDGLSLARSGSQLAGPLLVSIGSWLVVGVVENQIADLYLYIPIALIAGLRAAAVLRAQPVGAPAPDLPATTTVPDLVHPNRGIS